MNADPVDEDPVDADPVGADVATRLRTAPFEPVGRFAAASNATLLVRLADRDPRTLAQIAADLGRDVTLDDLPPDDLAVHKPRDGESPLWDFADGTLHLREVAAHEVSAALGWDLVPVTVLREDGPFGVGSLQRYVPHDPDEHYFELVDRGDAEVLDQLRAMVVFDLVIDNADRKGGHVLLERPAGAAADAAGRIRLVDHGVSFHVDRKLRTVAWHFVGEPVPVSLRDDVARFVDALDGEVGRALARLLNADELAVLADRARATADLEVFPPPSGPRPVPWPML